MMMNKPKQIRLWRVLWTSRMGVQAPAQECWAKTKREAGDIAKRMSRLADFPDTWSYRLEDLTDDLTEKERKRGIY